MIDLSIIIAVDDAHLNELTYTYKTWTKFHDDFFSQHQYIIVFDEEQISDKDKRFNMLKNVKKEFFPWKNFSNLYETQREKMLTSLIVAPSEYVKTEWYLKIDTDAICGRKDNWINEDWFKKNYVFISNPWGYTKPPDAIDIMDEWSDKFIDVDKYPRLNIHPNPGSDLVSHKRIISWLMFARTEWTKSISKFAKNKDGFYKLPVPSQDTYLIYFAQRMKFSYRRERFKKLGWDHISRFSSIRRRSKEILSK